jgi:hypothetical protein
MSGEMSYIDRVKNPDLSGLSLFPPPKAAGGLNIPLLSAGPRAKLAPHFDVVNLSWDEFQSMTRHASAPDTRLFTKDPQHGLRGPDQTQDLLWGLANEPGVRVMLRLAACMVPRRSLVIGSGTGLLPVFLSTTSAQGGHIDAVDLSYQSSSLSEAVVAVPRADLDYVPPDTELAPGYYIKLARDRSIRPDVTIQEHGLDSTRFFEGRAARVGSSNLENYDFILVDGAHTYAQAKIDITYSWAMLRPGGVLIVDDFDKSHVLGLEAVTVALHPVLDDGYMVFFVGQDERGAKTQVAFAVKDPEARRPGNEGAVQAAITRAQHFMANGGWKD